MHCLFSAQTMCISKTTKAFEGLTRTILPNLHEKFQPISRFYYFWIEREFCILSLPSHPRLTSFPYRAALEQRREEMEPDEMESFKEFASTVTADYLAEMFAKASNGRRAIWVSLWLASFVYAWYNIGKNWVIWAVVVQYW